MRLLVVNDFGIEGGGTENRVRLLLDEFLRRGMVESVDLLQSASRAVPQDLRISVTLTAGGVRQCYRRALRIIRQKKIDIVQAHNMLSVTPGAVAAARSAGVPVVWFAHDYWPLCAHRSFVDAFRARSRQTCAFARSVRCVRCSGVRACVRLWRFRRMMRQVRLAIASCPGVQSTYERHGLLCGKWRVIAPWIDTSIFHAHYPSAHRERTVVFTGSLIDYKGAWVLAHAAGRIRAQVPDVRFVFVSSGGPEERPFRAYIERCMREEGVVSGVVFKTHTSWQELAALYRTAGVYVCPTVCMETFGLNWAEAAACGVPVVASDAGSLPEFLSGKAVIVPARDHVKLADGVIRLFADDAFAQDLSARGARFCAGHFTVQAAALACFSEYQSLLGGRSHP